MVAKPFIKQVVLKKKKKKKKKRKILKIQSRLVFNAYEAVNADFDPKNSQPI